MYSPNTVQKAMNTKTLVTANTIFRSSRFFLWLLLKSEKNEKKIFEHLQNSKWRLLTQKKTRFVVTLISFSLLLFIGKKLIPFFKYTRIKHQDCFQRHLIAFFSVPTNQTGVNLFLWKKIRLHATNQKN